MSLSLCLSLCMSDTACMHIKVVCVRGTVSVCVCLSACLSVCLSDSVCLSVCEGRACSWNCVCLSVCLTASVCLFRWCVFVELCFTSHHHHHHHHLCLVLLITFSLGGENVQRLRSSFDSLINNTAGTLLSGTPHYSDRLYFSVCLPLFS